MRLIPQILHDPEHATRLHAVRLHSDCAPTCGMLRALCADMLRASCARGRRLADKQRSRAMNRREVGLGAKTVRLNVAAVETRRRWPRGRWSWRSQGGRRDRGLATTLSPGTQVLRHSAQHKVGWHLARRGSALKLRLTRSVQAGSFERGSPGSRSPAWSRSSWCCRTN